MSFCRMMELLQKKNKGKIVFCNAGNFYIAIGRDAILLNDLLNLKISCIKQELCKVGFPIVSLEKYTDLLQEKKYSYIVYYYDQKKEELEILLEYNGKKTNKIEEKRKNCYICKNNIKGYKKHDKYIEAVAKLYEKEIEKEKELQNE